MQSLLGSLNYYSRFIKYFSVYASVLNELREAGFHEIRRAYADPRTVEAAERNRLGHTAHTGDSDQYLVSGGDQKLHQIPGGDQELHPIAGVIRNHTNR